MEDDDYFLCRKSWTLHVCTVLLYLSCSEAYALKCATSSQVHHVYTEKKKLLISYFRSSPE